MSEVTYTRKDFTSDIDVRWCPGCGDFNILSTMQTLLPKLGKKKEDIVFISGIGCSSRFPYYMDTYGFHTIHGRAPSIATGVKGANPDLDVWVITGDGDGISIGGNHLIHAIRRNQDIKILMFNNNIYGLTKGQYSPTTAVGTKTGSTPFGSIDYPINPLSLVVGANGGFVARTADNDPKHMAEVFEKAWNHKGAVFVEILQNCVIFNDKVHEEYYGRATRNDTLLYLHDGEPMIFGKEVEKGIFVENGQPVVKELTDDNRDDVFVHSEKDEMGIHAFLLSKLTHPEFPVPVGVFRNISKETYDQLLYQQIDQVKSSQKGSADLEDLLYSGSTWEVE